MFREYGPPDDFRTAPPPHTPAEPVSFPLAPESKRRSRRPLGEDGIQRDKFGEPEDHDALADLFLGELGQVAARDAAMGLTPWAPRATASDVTDRPSLGHAMRAPEVEPERRGARRNEISTGWTERAKFDGMAPQALSFEALVLGHLPVMGSAWAHQYARSRSRLNGGKLDIAVVRCFDGHARVDLSVRTQFGVDDIPGHVARSVSHIVIFGDAQSEQSLITSPHVDRVTILCGTDEAGIVDAYRTLKALSDTRSWSNSGCRLGVAIMGATGTRAATAFARLRDSAKRFLGISIDDAGQFDKIEGGPAMHTIGTLPFSCPDGGPAEVLRRLAAAAAAGASGPQDPALDLGLRTATAEAFETAEDLKATPEQDREESAQSMRAAEPTANARPSQVCDSGPQEALSDETAKAVRGPSLIAAHFPGLTPLAARCPFAEDVELAMDASGGLHVLGAALANSTADATVSRITAVLGWTRTNRSVLALTLPGGRGLDCSRMPVGHFVTTEPAAHRTLLDSTLCVHVLAPVVKTISSDWVVVALN